MNDTNLAHTFVLCMNITAICVCSRLFDISNVEPSAIGISLFIAVVMIVFDVAYLAFGLDSNCLDDLIKNTLLGGHDE